jgi:hypothetical protein
MGSRTWVVVVTAGLMVSASAGRGQEGRPMPLPMPAGADQPKTAPANASPQRIQEPEAIAAPAGMEPSPVEDGMVEGPAPTAAGPCRPVRDWVASHCCKQADAPRRPIRDWLGDRCCKMAEADCNLCPKGHRIQDWLTYHSEARGFCQSERCCPPPLYTFFLNPACDNGAPCDASKCAEENRVCVDGHRLKQLFLWRPLQKHSANSSCDAPYPETTAAAVVPAAHP